MDRFAAFNALLLWGASFYLVTHGVLPPASTEAEARELAEAVREAAAVWVSARVRAASAWAAWLLSAS